MVNWWKNCDFWQVTLLLWCSKKVIYQDFPVAKLSCAGTGWLTALAPTLIVERVYHFLSDDRTFSLLAREQIGIFYAPHLAARWAGCGEYGLLKHIWEKQGPNERKQGRKSCPKAHCLFLDHGNVLSRVRRSIKVGLHSLITLCL